MKRNWSVVVDTNLIVSGLILEVGLPYELFLSCKANLFTLILSKPILEELERTLSKPKLSKYGFTQDKIHAILFQLREVAVIIDLLNTLPLRVRDPKDEIILITALDGDADYLVTGDKDLLTLNGHPKIDKLKIVTVKEFLEKVSS